MKILLILSTAFDVSNVDRIPVIRDERNEQYYDGFKKFFELNQNNIKESKFDICLSDNTINDIKEIDDKIQEVLKPIKINYNLLINNEYGSINKGSGLITSWLRIKNKISEYDFIIHFEPKQLLLDNVFIESFLNEKDNLFTINKNSGRFNTGLFAIKSQYLLNYIEQNSDEFLCNHNISIEDSLFLFMLNTEYRTIDKMGLIYYDCSNNVKKEM
jgi:hypothetical protein